MILHIFTHTVIDGDPESVVQDAGETINRLREYASVEALTVHAGDLPEWVEGNTRFCVDSEHPDWVWLEIESGDPSLDSGELRRLAAQALAEAERLDRYQGQVDQENTAARRVMAEYKPFRGDAPTVKETS